MKIKYNCIIISIINNIIISKVKNKCLKHETSFCIHIILFLYSY